MSTRIYVGGLPIKVESDNIKKKFSKYGDILSVDLKEKKDIDGNLLSKFAYVNLAAETVKVLECVSFFNGAQWKGCELKVELAKESFLDRLKRERESEKSGVPDKGDSHTADYDDGYQRNNKRYKTDFNIYNEDGNSYNGPYGKSQDAKMEPVNDNFQARYKNEVESEKSGIANEDDSASNYYDDSYYSNNNRQREYSSNSNENEKTNFSNFAPRNEWKNRSQNSHHFGSDIPKPIEMIRYDPTKPQNAAKNLSKELNLDSPTAAVVKTEKVQHDHNAVATKKISVFGKLDFSESAFSLSEALSGKTPESPSKKDQSNDDKPYKKSSNVSIIEEARESSPQKGNSPIKRKGFMDAGDAFLEAEAMKLMKRTSTEEFNKEYEKVKSLLFSIVSVTGKHNNKANNRSKKGKSKKSR